MPCVLLERPSRRRERAFLAAVRRSRRLHGVFVEAPGSPEEYAEYLRRARRPTQASFLVVEPGSDELVGVVNVNDIVRDSLGYYAFEPHAGRGFMHRALRLVVAQAFGKLKLHRLEASIQSTNSRSIRLVESLGFTLEGTSRRYLKIRGRWRDHQRWALLAEDWRAASRAAASDALSDRRHVHTSSTARTTKVKRSSAAAAIEIPAVNASSNP